MSPLRRDLHQWPQLPPQAPTRCHRARPGQPSPQPFMRRQDVVTIHHVLRTLPAGAGSAPASSPERTLTGVGAGPSPQARGRLDGAGRHFVRERTIPAGAGATCRARSCGWPTSNHPSGRGGDTPSQPAAFAPVGPSPRAKAWCVTRILSESYRRRSIAPCAGQAATPFARRAMTAQHDGLINRLEQGTNFLLLSQKHLSLESGEDPRGCAGCGTRPISRPALSPVRSSRHVSMRLHRCLDALASRRLRQSRAAGRGLRGETPVVAQPGRVLSCRYRSVRALGSPPGSPISR